MITELTKTVNANESGFIEAVKQSASKSVLIPIASTEKTATDTGDYLPLAEQFSELNAPTVVIAVRATPDAAENVSALLARYRGDDPKAGVGKIQESQKPKA